MCSTRWPEQFMFNLCLKYFYLEIPDMAEACKVINGTH